MLRFTVDGVKHEFDPTKLTFGEGRALERVTGYPFKDIETHATAGELTVLQAFVWIAMKRQDPTLQFSGLDDVSLADIEFHGDDGEAPDPTGGGTSTPAA